MKVYDLFPFFNELELLELRVEELRDLVTYTGLVELPVTFTDQPKPLYFRQVALEFAGTGNIHTYTPPSYPSGPHPTVDWFQRRQTSVHLKDANPDDVVMLSDVDEIPNRNVVRRYIEEGIDTPVTVWMKLYYHRVDLQDQTGWAGTVICRRKNLGPEPDMQQLRGDRGNFPSIDGGWHFSWLGDADAISKKLDAVDIIRENEIYGAHGIQEPPRDPKFLQACYAEGKDLFRRGRDKQLVPIIPGVNQPHEIEAWLKRYPQYTAVDAVPY